MVRGECVLAEGDGSLGVQSDYAMFLQPLLGMTRGMEGLTVLGALGQPRGREAQKRVLEGRSHLNH